ncbi:acyl-CoA dehydrogenase family protein [Actinokineospora globicatena]|uniref:acyl-CoA dehydrogenase family protein n=1 Tax=Actinokineospora globicatena TaxID=103729 RepID=UPI0020A5961E|nr:acyl-CoA dehydrogenase family protein [Actinokineospora globicatena]MCP2303556.1 Acyl-CoA dehydrogenase [Actinokineospora globicatena]GLW79307.1 putative oxidoreductase [Actinokineospora globicatena]GLW86283.1 putative oxidoreductase [Actinokineospora globicatena]
MRFMEADRLTCEELLPGLLDALAEIPLAELESEKNPAIELFREHGGTNLVVPAAYGGLDATALQAARVVRALAAVAPSMAVATAMHHFSVGTLFGVAETFGAGTDLDDALLRQIARNRWLVASGFAEGRTEQGILSPTMEARPTAGGYLVSGSKKPCSLSRSMDLFTGSVGMRREDGSVEMGFLMLPATTPGIEVVPFWGSFALAGAQSDEVRLTDVEVTDAQILQPPADLLAELSELQQVGLIWFEMTVCATYTGIASALVQRVLDAKRGAAADRAALAVRIESAAALVEGLARRVMDGEVDNDTLATSLATRFTVQELVRTTVGEAVELLGGMAFVGSSDVAYLSAAAQAVAFHPPSRTSMIDGLLGYYAGEPLVVQ